MADHRHVAFEAVKSWLNKYNLSHLQDTLVKHGLNSIEQCVSFAKTPDIEQSTKLLLNKVAEHQVTTSNLINAFDSLLKLQQTDEFLASLNQRCKVNTNTDTTTQSHTNNNNNNINEQWTLVLIDCDDVESLLYEKKITNQDVENSINLLQASIYRLIENKNENKHNKIFGYHLGGDLFALFINDNDNMDKSKKIGQHLINVMQDKNKSSFTISVGIGIRPKLLNDQKESESESKTKKKEKDEETESNSEETKDCKKETDLQSELRREWVLRAHTNLMKAKENGKNCCIHKWEKIDASKNNQQLESMAQKIDDLYKNGFVDESESLYYDIISKFDENTILNQTITPSTASSIPFQIARIIFSGKVHIGNEKYRGYAAYKNFKRLMKTFICGKMSIACYYYYKSWECDYIHAMDRKAVGMRIKHRQIRQAALESQSQSTKDDLHSTTSPTSPISPIEYDITLLTRYRTADPIISPVVKNTALYWIKLGWEHLKDSSESSSIVGAFVYEIGLIGKAFGYYEKLSIEMIKMHPQHAWVRCNLAGHYYRSSIHSKAFDYCEQSVIDIPNNTTVLGNIMHYYSQSLNLGSRLQSNGYTRKERAEKALEYGKQLIDLSSKGQYVRNTRFALFAELLCNWSGKFDDNRDEQKLALSMYEKAIHMDQFLGRDVINNWTRDYIIFESGLRDLIVRYWYVANDNGLRSRDILNCADLIETYFNDNDEKMKRAKELSDSVPIESNVVVYVKTDQNNNKRAMHYVSIRKPAKCQKKRILDYIGLDFSDYGIVLAWWYMDEGRGMLAMRNMLQDYSTTFTEQYAAKLACYFAFMCGADAAGAAGANDEKEMEIEIEIESGLRMKIDREFKVLIIKILVHYCWKLYQKTHESVVNMIQHSNIFTRMANDFMNNANNPDEADINKIWTLNKIGQICDKIEKMVDLNSQDCILKVADILEPKFVFTKGDYDSVTSINGYDIECLLKDPYNLKEEIKICNLTLNGMGNAYNDGYRFTQWNFNPQYTRFDSALACCIVEMLCNIAKEQ